MPTITEAKKDAAAASRDVSNLETIVSAMEKLLADDIGDRPRIKLDLLVYREYLDRARATLLKIEHWLELAK